MKKQKSKKRFSKKDMISFGNYMVSKRRNESVSEINKSNVTDADFENWKEEKIERLDDIDRKFEYITIQFSGM